MGKVWLVFGVLVICSVAVQSANAPAPAPAADCSTVILSMTDCLTFVSNGSKETKPKESCCNGLKTILKTNAECLCEAFKNSGSFGIALNMTKALTLPSACGVSTSPLSKCDAHSPSPSPSHAHSPSPTPSPIAHPPAGTPPATSSPPSPTPPASSPSPSSIWEVPAPAPGPTENSATSVSIQFVLLIGVAVASCSLLLA